MLVYTVVKQNRDKEVDAVYVFDKHIDALRCRRELGLKSEALRGTSIGCYEFKQSE